MSSEISMLEQRLQSIESIQKGCVEKVVQVRLMFILDPSILVIGR